MKKKIIVFLAVLLVSVTSFSQKKNAMADSVFAYICELGIRHPDIVIKQAILESGWFKAPFLMSRNNIFAFRKVNYMRFSSWRACVEYYKQWQDKRYTNPKEDYYAFLARIKYGAPGYPSHVKKIRYSNTCK